MNKEIKKNSNENSNENINANSNLSKNLKETNEFEFIDDNWYMPGIFRVVCTTKNKAFFGESYNTYLGAEDFVLMLEQGCCENQELVNDYKTFASEGFKVSVVHTDPLLGDRVKRRAKLEEYKNLWPGELY